LGNFFGPFGIKRNWERKEPEKNQCFPSQGPEPCPKRTLFKNQSLENGKLILGIKIIVVNFKNGVKRTVKSL